jgi:hypothetical protein
MNIIYATKTVQCERCGHEFEILANPTSKIKPPALCFLCIQMEDNSAAAFQRLLEVSHGPS